jgi:integrase
MNEHTTIDTIINEVMKALSAFGLADGSIELYVKHFLKMQKFFRKHDNKYFSENFLNEYWSSLIHRSKPYSPKYLSALRRSIDLVTDYNTKKFITWSHRKRVSAYIPCDYYQRIIDYSIHTLQLEGSTKAWFGTILRKFCCKLEAHGIFEFSQISPALASSIITGFGNENPRSMRLVVSSIKRFFEYLNGAGLSTLEITPALYVTYKRTQHIPPFSIEEIKSLLQACDRTTSIGKRNYSILLLAVTCGLRRSDLIGLKLSDIDWHRYELRIIQSKTKKTILLPMLGEAGNAIADYILSARPNGTGFEYIFLTAKAPRRPMIASAFNDMLLKLCEKASVPKIVGRNFHSLRRSAGTWMANSGVPVTTIAQVLGHSGFHSADRYISADPKMVSCSLDFTGITPTSEVYR